MGGTNGALYTGDVDFISLPYASDPTFWAIPLERKPCARNWSGQMTNHLALIPDVTVNGQEVSISEASTSTLAAIDTATSLSKH